MLGVQIPDAAEIARLTAEAMEPMQTKLDRIADAIDELVKIQTRTERLLELVLATRPDIVETVAEKPSRKTARAG